jgi:hypothetical protein
VLADGAVVGRMMKAAAAPVGTPWLWTLVFGHHEDRTPTHGHEPTRGRDGGVRAGGTHQARSDYPIYRGNPENMCSLRVFLGLTLKRHHVRNGPTVRSSQR